MGLHTRLAELVANRVTNLSDAELDSLHKAIEVQRNIRNARAELRLKRIGELNAAIAQLCADFPEMGISLDRGVLSFYNKDDPPAIKMLPAPEHYKMPHEKAARKTVWMIHAPTAKDPQQRKAKVYTDKDSCLRRATNLLRTQTERVAISAIQGTVSTFTLQRHAGLGKV